MPALPGRSGFYLHGAPRQCALDKATRTSQRTSRPPSGRHSCLHYRLDGKPRVNLSTCTASGQICDLGRCCIDSNALEDRFGRLAEPHDRIEPIGRPSELDATDLGGKPYVMLSLML